MAVFGGFSPPQMNWKAPVLLPVAVCGALALRNPGKNFEWEAMGNFGDEGKRDHELRRKGRVTVSFTGVNHLSPNIIILFFQLLPV